MATEELYVAWNEYEEAVRAFYERFGVADVLEDVVSADLSLERISDFAEHLTDRLAELLDTVDRERREPLITLAAAAAAVDVAVACDAIARDPERPPEAELAGAMPASPIELLDDASRMYRLQAPPDVAGAQEAPVELLIDECESAFDELVSAAYDPATDFAGDILSTGLGGLGHAIASDLFPRLARVARSVGRIKRPAVKLLTTGLHKMLAASKTSAGELFDNALDFFDEAAVEALKEAVRNRLELFLGAVAGRGHASREVRVAIERRAPIEPAVLASIRGQLQDLTGSHHRLMKKTETIAKLIGFVSPVLKLLAAPSAGGGPALVLALDGFGLGFVICSLRMRITGRVLSHRVDGVVTIVS